MSLKRTLIIAVIFAALVGFYMFDQKRVATNTAREEEESRLVTPLQAALTELQVTQGGTAFTLAKTSDTWGLTAPLAARADRAAVEGMLSSLDSARKKDPFEVPAANLKEYGLDTPVLTAEVKAAGANYVEKINIGAETTAGDEVYVRLGEGSKVYTVPVSVKTALTKQAGDLRDKRLLPANINQATNLTLNFDGKQFALVQREGKWSITEPVPGRADMDRVSEILREWNNAKVQDFIDTDTQNLAKYGLDNPSWRGTVLAEGEDPRTSAALHTLLIGGSVTGDVTRRYAKAEGEPTIFTIQDTLLPKLQPTIDALRSKEVFTIAADQVGRVTFNTRGNAMTLVKNGASQWRFADDANTPLDQASISTKINDLIALKAERFITTDTTQAGLDDPNLVVTISNTSGTTTQSLATGRKADTEDIVYARMGGVAPDGDVIALNWQDPGKFFITREDLIDKNLFDFDTEVVRKVEISEGTRTLTLTRAASGTWSGKLGDTDKTIEPAQVNALLFAATSLAWSRTLNPASETDKVLIKTQNLENPARQVTFMDEVGNQVGRLGIGGEDDRTTYLRKGADAYYAIDKARLLSLSDALRGLIEHMERK